mmetsp:Transcript_31584/g.78151  ORF Transcript_31584/g.78151 Transcript_31584/m.78151 type:complete len:215 (-) Transcript_31584:2155-2799(-)
MARQRVCTHCPSLLRLFATAAGALARGALAAALLGRGLWLLRLDEPVVLDVVVVVLLFWLVERPGLVLGRRVLVVVHAVAALRLGGGGGLLDLMRLARPPLVVPLCEGRLGGPVERLKDARGHPATLVDRRAVFALGGEQVEEGKHRLEVVLVQAVRHHHVHRLVNARHSLGERRRERLVECGQVAQQRLQLAGGGVRHHVRVQVACEACVLAG